jgi:putative two-component system response regulator
MMVFVAGSVLVVDDEESIRHLLSLVVGRAGGDPPELAVSSQDAVEKTRGRRFDVCIIDKNLPDGSGLELMRMLRDSAPETLCLIVTGYGNMDSAIEALRLGAFDYILKPFDIAAVTHRIRLALERSRLGRALALSQAETARAERETKRAYLETVMTLARVAEFADDSAAVHAARMSRYAAILARALDATPAWIETITCATPLHDIGKIGIPDAILSKPGPLSATEREIVQRHVAIGARILEGNLAEGLSMAREIVLTHHERWDGTGYPHRLAGEQIPLSGRIVALCDAWDAVSNDRPYRQAMTDDAALAELKQGSGSHFDPAVVDAFFMSWDQIRAVREAAPSEDRAAS